MNSQIRVTLHVDQNEEETRVFDEPRQCYVGRATDCDLQVPSAHENRDISRHHCLFSIDPPNLWIQDLGSKNGTFVNGTRISDIDGNNPIELRDGDEVRIGHQVLRVEIEENTCSGEMAALALPEWVT